MWFIRGHLCFFPWVGCFWIAKSEEYLDMMTPANTTRSTKSRKSARLFKKYTRKERRGQGFGICRYLDCTWNWGMPHNMFFGHRLDYMIEHDKKWRSIQVNQRAKRIILDCLHRFPNKCRWANVSNIRDWEKTTSAYGIFSAAMKCVIFC